MGRLEKRALKKLTFFKVLADFYAYPKSGDDITLSFFDFLEEKYPSVWERLNEFYADDWTWHGADDESSRYPYNPRQPRYGWDDLLKPEHFEWFLAGIKEIWPFLSDQEFGTCHYCKKEDAIEIEHRIIVSYEFGPHIKFYENHEMDGSWSEEVYCCRSCAHSMLVKLGGMMDAEKETCWF